MKHHLEDGGRGSFNKKKFQTFDQEEEVEATGFRAKLKQFLLDPQNAMPIIITVEIVRVLIIFLFEISSEMGHNKEMLFADNFESSGYDYEKIFGDSYSAEAYPAIGLYLGLLEYNLSDGGRNPGVGKGISGLFYIATVWCVVRIYQNAFKDQPKYSNIVLLLCFMLFPVTISVSGCALDLKALFF